MRSGSSSPKLLPLFALVVLCACRPTTLEGPDYAATLDPDGRTLSIASGDRALMDLDLSRVAFWRARAGFEMQFGMFNIQEARETEPVFPDEVEAIDAEPGIGFLLHRGGEQLATAILEPVADRHLKLTLTGPADDNRAQVAFGCGPEDHFVGLGAHTHDIDHRGQRVPLWVSEQGIGKTDDNELPEVWQLLGRRHTTHIPVPAMTTSRGTAVVLETYAHSIFDLCATDGSEVLLESWEPKIVLHLFIGDDPRSALGLMNEFLGRPPLPAEWMHAPWNDAIFGSDSVREFAQFLRDEGISSGAIWTEDWKGGNDQGDFYRLEGDWRLDRELYPDYEELAEDLRDLGFMHQLYFNTFVTDNAEVFPEVSPGLVVKDENGDAYTFTGAEDGFRDSVLIDLTDPEAQAFVRAELQAALDLGARGWMADYGEWMPIDGAVIASGEDPALVHNRYPVEWHKLNFEVLEEAGLLDEAIVFARSGHLFAQGYTQVVWGGDQRTSFQPDDGLPTVIPIGAGLSAGGYLFYAHDIAGYQSATNDPVTPELFFRWTELGAFSPIMRTHHGTHARFNHNLRTDAETTAHWKRYANLHTRLYPYTRGLAVQAVEEGIPMWLPMGLVDPSDAAIWNVLDQVWLGDKLLIAPVVAEGATSRDVVLPEGRFVRFSDAGLGEPETGPAAITAEAPLGEIPVYLRAGGILPLTANTPLTLIAGATVAGLETAEGDRDVYVALGADGAFTEASGATYELTSSAPEEGSVTITGDGTVSLGSSTLTLSGHPPDRTTRVFFR
jgi:alpha-glucosidase (family GH31 glycosyl hydrolase)